jgi:creatinine amidohydrolase
MAVHDWNRLSTTEFLDLDRQNTVVLLPLGATEQHGPHLPVGTDFFLVEEVLRRVKPRINDLDGLILPPLWCTKSNEHVAFAGSLYLQAETMMAMIHDIAASISRSGFKRVVLMNWHGGNSDLLGALVRDIRQRHKLMAFLIDIVFTFMGLTSEPGDQTPGVDMHAGRYETSMMLAANPGMVKPGPYENIGSDMERGRLAESFSGYKLLAPEGGAVRIGWETTDLSADGVIGDPAGSSAEEGERSLAVMAERVEAALREIARFEYKVGSEL